MIYFHFRDAAYLRDVVSEVRISEQNTKEKLVFIFIFERKYLRDEVSEVRNPWHASRSDQLVRAGTSTNF